MGSSMKGSTKQESTQTSAPPKWAQPLLEKAAGAAMDLYNSGQGYNVYRGPTQAQFSDARLEGLNNALTMTGAKSRVSNESVFNNPAIQQARGMIQQQQDADAARKAAAAQAAAAAANQKKVGSALGDYYIRGIGGGNFGYGSGDAPMLVRRRY